MKWSAVITCVISKWSQWSRAALLQLPSNVVVIPIPAKTISSGKQSFSGRTISWSCLIAGSPGNRDWRKARLRLQRSTNPARCDSIGVMQRPETSEYHPNYQKYFDLAPAGDYLELLRQNS